MGPDRGAVLVDGVGRRRDEADERLAVGAGEGLRDDVGAGWVDGGGGVAILHLHRCALEAGREGGLVERPPLLEAPREVLGRAEVGVHLSSC